jgi:hypothetical protein
MIFNRYFFEDIEGVLLSLIDVVIVGSEADERSSMLARKWQKKFGGKTHCLPYDVKTENCALIEISLGDEVARQSSKPITDITDLYAMLGSVNLAGQNVLIDFTGMEQPAIFYLLYCLRQQRLVKGVFGLYTEPLRYKTFSGPLFEEAFDLTDEFIPFKAVPGFVRPYDRSKEKLLLVFMGFEGRRFLKVFEEVNPKQRRTHAVFGIPAYQPGWQYLTLGTNQQALEASRAMLHRAEANNPFDAYEIALRVFQSYPEAQLILAPIGTKPHAVGSVMFANRYADTIITYDFPVKQRIFRTEGVGKTSVYNLTEVILG